MTASTELADRGSPAGSGRLPDFLIVGHHKSGTTALYEMLRRHPQIFMPDLKEPRYFATDLRRRVGPRVEWLPETLEEYTALFDAAAPDQRAGEASPLYLVSQTAAAAIAAVQPKARIIAILREPAGFLQSLHQQFVQNYIEDQNDLRRALALEPERRQGRSMPKRFHMPQLLMYSEHVRYVEQLRRYHAVFPPEQVLVLIYDDFRADNEATVRRVLRFLEVDDAGPIEPIEANRSVHVRSVRLNEMMRSLYFGRGPAWRTLKRLVKASTPQRVRRDALAGVHRRVVYSRGKVADEQLTRELRQRFAPEVRALGDYLGRDMMSLWGYDSVG
jgi:Sulfotransferase domain